MFLWDFLGSSNSKESACSAGDLGSIPGLGRFLGGGQATHSVFLPGESHGQRIIINHKGRIFANVNYFQH